MKTLFEYVQEAEKEYNFRIKFAVPVTSEMVTKMENLLAKFDVKKISDAKKTIMQGRALDFANSGPTEVYILDAVMGLPATREAIRDVLANGLKVSLDKIVVRTPEEPLETDREENKPAEKALLLSDYEKTEPGDKFFGDKYNQELIKNHKSDFTFEIAGGKPKADAGPDYGKDSKSPISGGRTDKHPKKV